MQEHIGNVITASPKSRMGLGLITFTIFPLGRLPHSLPSQSSGSIDTLCCMLCYWLSVAPASILRSSSDNLAVYSDNGNDTKVEILKSQGTMRTKQ